MRKRRADGLSMIEVLVALTLFTAVAIALLSHASIMFNDTAARKDKIFAFKKAQGILAELQAFVDRGEVDAAIDLDSMDDGTSFNPVLTIATDAASNPVAPDHVLSGNIQRQANWIWSRRITVQPFQGLNNRNVRYVTVRVFKRSPRGNQNQMAVISSVINSAGSSYPSSQHYDVFFVAIENVPGWWVYMDAIKPFVEATVADLQARNPGLQLRTHWITKLAYGRNPRYTPYVNQAADSVQAVPGAYYYPGTMPAGNSSTYYYVPDNFRGRINLDGTLTNTVANPPENDERTGPYHEYTLADQFNQAKRYYDERELFERRRASGDEDELAPTWRMLLEEMCSNPDKFHNAIIVNLHGELLPMPPLRNYSDPAKDIGNTTQNYKFARVVTHPEKLRFSFDSATPTKSEDIRFRVYPYLSDPGAAGAPGSLDYITLDLLCSSVDSDGDLLPLDYHAPGAITIQNFSLPGDTVAMVNPTPEYFTAAHPDNPYGVGFTRLRFQNTPLTHGQDPSQADPLDQTRGLNTSARLYGLEYIPCPMAGQKNSGEPPDQPCPLQFTNLDATGNGPKNTARWVVTLPYSGLPKTVPGGNHQNLVIKAITRVGNFQTLAEVQGADPENESTTYAWWADSVDPVPFTERFQFIGDPRHCPYADNMYWEWNFNPAYPTYGNNFPNGYNPFWDDFGGSQAFWQALSSGDRQFNTHTGNGWPYLLDYWGDRQDFDVARFHQVLRRALTRSEAIYTTLTGYSYYYLGIGNEIGYDSANGYPSSIPVNGAPWGASGASTIYVDNISGGGSSTYRYSKLLRDSQGSGWWGLYWLGELYPDTVFDTNIWGGSGGADWVTLGNLPTNTWGYGNEYRFFRDRKQDITWNLPGGTVLDYSRKVLSTTGCGSMLLCGTPGSTFNHLFKDGQSGSLTGAGPEMADNYAFPLPTSTKISRPFQLNLSNYPTQNAWTYAFPRYQGTVVRQYYDHSCGAIGSALIQLTEPSTIQIGPSASYANSSPSSSFIVVNGLDRTIESGSAFIAKYAMVSLLHSFFEAGQVAGNSRIVQVPRVQILSPTDITQLDDPVTIDVTFGVEWKRWDGKAYTENTSTGFSESESSLAYVLTYSNDGGTSWFHVLDDSTAQHGILPSDPTVILLDGVTGDETYTWGVNAAAFPEGSYLVKVECFRNNEMLHYSSHMVKIFIER